MTTENKEESKSNKPNYVGAMGTDRVAAWVNSDSLVLNFKGLTFKLEKAE